MKLQIALNNNIYTVISQKIREYFKIVSSFNILNKFIVKFSINFLIVLLIINFNMFIFPKINKNAFLLLLLFLTVFSQKGDINEYLPRVQDHQIIFQFTTTTNGFEMNVLLTTGSLLQITLRDFQDWAIYTREYTNQDIGRQIDKSFLLEDITKKLQCSPTSLNDPQHSTEKYQYGQIIEYKEQPCFRIQRNGLIVVYLAKQVKIISWNDKKVYQVEVELKLNKVRSMTRLQIEKVKNHFINLQKQNAQKTNVYINNPKQIQLVTPDNKWTIQNTDQIIKPELRVKQTVFDLFKDKRQLVNLVYPFPYSTIGIVEVKRGGSRIQGTGFLIAPNIVMTAAHNLYDKKLKDQIRSIIFWLGVVGVQGKKFQIKKYFIPERYKDQTKQNINSDYCIMILQEKVQKNYGYLPVDWSGENIGEIQIAGYPAYVYREGMQKKAPNQIHMDKGVCEKDRYSQGMIRYQVQTSSGQSGSPIITQKNGEFKVIGIHTIGQQTFNQGVLLSNQIRIQINQWLAKEKIQNAFSDLGSKINLKTEKVPQEKKQNDRQGAIGLKEGKGTEKYANGDIYEGEFKQGNKHGKGVVFTEDGKFQGIWQNGLRQKGIFTEKDGTNGQLQYTYKSSGEVIQSWLKNGVQYWRYTGPMKNERKDGFGIQVWQNGDKFAGNYNNGKKQGKGTFQAQNGDKYEGEFKNNRAEGHGAYFWSNGNNYIGEWKNGKRQGNGTLSLVDGLYAGEFKDNNFEGHGTYYSADGRKWIGDWKDGNRHGKGVQYLVNGDKYEQTYQSGVQISSRII